MVLWIGVDDTDSLKGMCTTFLATELVRELTPNLSLIGFPRLVRLNPNIPWKTRGNGAICLRVGRGVGPSRRVGRIDGREIASYDRARSGSEPDDVRDIVESVVERWSRLEDPTTHPGIAILERPADPGLYWKAVREVVTKEEAVRAAQGRGFIRGYKKGRGLIGAIAATSWRPRDRTYEILAYREATRWGTPRVIDPTSVVEMDRAFPSTFNNYDYENNRVVIAPRSPCPVLYGIRGDNSSVLEAAMRVVRGEPPDRWVVFETNQGTDDHVRRSSTPEPWAALRLRGQVTSTAVDLPGGHVVIRVRGHDVTAYEPSKQFRSVVRSLAPGDRVEVIGSVRAAPRTINLEKILVLSVAQVVRKVANPRCEKCRKRAKSIGHAAGYRCSRCGFRFRESAAVRATIGRNLRPGWYEPPAGSRRHLSMPLKRMGEANRAEQPPVSILLAARASGPRISEPGPSEPLGYPSLGSGTSSRGTGRPSRR